MSGVQNSYIVMSEPFVSNRRIDIISAGVYVNAANARSFVNLLRRSKDTRFGIALLDVFFFVLTRKNIVKIFENA